MARVKDTHNEAKYLLHMSLIANYVLLPKTYQNMQFNMKYAKRIYS